MGPALGSIARLVRKKGIKIIALTDNVIPHEKRPGDPAFTRYFIRACDGFVTMSKAVMKDLSLFTASSHKTFLVHPLYTAFGEKVNRQEARKIMGVGETDRMVLFFGLIRKYKGLDMLLEAMANERIKKAGIKLLVAGEFYEDRSEYDKLIHTLGIEQQVILHTRFIANEEVKNYFSACNLVALPYRSATQSGVTQVAFHFEQPVLVTNVGGLNEIIPHGKAGYVVESNAEAIANAVLDFFENKREEAFTEGMKQEKQKYDWRIFVNGITALYEKL